MLRSRVRTYFSENNISKHANGKMVFKTFFMIALYFTPYALMMAGVVSSNWGLVGLWAFMGIGLAGIGLSIMHDANHSAYSKNERVNVMIGKILNVVGGYAFNWKVQHNVLHHSFTNIEGMDEDITPVAVLRFSPHAKRYKAHRYQHIYAWFFYSLMTFLWITTKDFMQLIRYKKKGLIDKNKYSFAGLMAELIFWKLFYYTYMVVLPLIFLDIAWWMFPILLFVKHAVAGLILASIFQPAHVVPTSEYPLPSEDGSIDNVWFVHQLNTTADFAPKAKLFGWFVGGLNFQVEHHLFPGICHVHYPKIAKIVEDTCKEHGIPYHSFPTFGKAIREHTAMLKKLGRSDAAA